MGKHTAGPWQVGNFKPNSVFTCEENGPVEVGTFKRKSDAALVASAPDLLQALETLLNNIAHGDDTQQAQIVAFAAIARARGQA